MSTYIVVGVALAYAWVSADHLMQGQYGLALTWAAYAVANTGLILAGKGI